MVFTKRKNHPQKESTIKRHLKGGHCLRMRMSREFLLSCQFGFKRKKSLTSARQDIFIRVRMTLLVVV